jgi:hypothetical protein
VPDLSISVSANPSRVGQNVGLAVTATRPPQPVSAQWSFGDGAPPGNSLTPNHTWTSAGTFRVTVTAAFPDGRTNTRTVTQTVNPPAPPKGTLTVTVTGPGKVTSSPAGINCPTRCSAQFTENTVVTLSATPTPGEQFEEFGGDCPANGQPTCQLTITTAGASVTAGFTDVVNFHTLTLNITDPASGDGGGMVDVFDSNGFNNQCVDATCVKDYPDTETLRLTPNAEGAGVSRFDHWTGACTGTSQTCRVRMTANRTVTAVFVRCPVTGCAGPAVQPAAAPRRAGRTAGPPSGPPGSPSATRPRPRPGRRRRAGRPAPGR